MEPQENVAVPVNLIGSRINSLDNNIDILDKRMCALWERLAPILGPPGPQKTLEEPGKAATESLLAIQLITMCEKTDKIIQGIENLIQRIQC